MNKPRVYDSGISVIGAFTNIPDGVVIGKNCEVAGDTTLEHYTNNSLESGQSLIVEGGL